MHYRKYASKVVLVLLAVGLGAGAFETRQRWLPIIVPDSTAKGKDQDHGHSHDEDGGHIDGGHDHGHDHGHGEGVRLSVQAIDNLKLDVDLILPQPYFRTVQIPGSVVDRPGETDRGVTARVGGIVTEINARPGDTVKAGDPLFTIQIVSEFAQSAQTELVKAARELSIADAKLKRSAELVKIGTKSAADLIEDENQVKRISTLIQAVRRQLLTIGLTPAQITDAENGRIVTEIVVIAPERVPGARDAKDKVTSAEKAEPTVYEVQDLKVQLGESVQGGQALCTLSNHRILFIEGRAFKSEAKVLADAAKNNWEVKAEFADEAPGDWPALGPLYIQHLSNAVDPISRTFSFFVPLMNQSESYTKNGNTYFVWRFRPGQRVLLKVNVERVRFDKKNKEDEVFVLPIAGLVREGGEAFVFKQNGDFFQRIKVRVLHEDRDEVVIANDESIRPGQPIVRNQASALNRALKANGGAPWRSAATTDRSR